MAGEKSQTLMQARAPANTSLILKSHLGVVFAILGGIAVLIVITATAVYFYLKAHYRKIKERQEQAIELEQQAPWASPPDPPALARVKTQSSSGIDPAEDALLRRPDDLSHRYGMADFGGFDPGSIKSIANNSRPFLPGDVVIPENCASAARKIRDTSAVLTPPTTPERHKITTIDHWYIPRGDAEAIRSVQKAPILEAEMLDAAPVPLAIPDRNQLSSNHAKKLPMPPADRLQEDNTYRSRPEKRGIYGEGRANGRRRSQSAASLLTNRRQSPHVHRLRKFGELEDNGRDRSWKLKHGSQVGRSMQVKEILSMLTSPSYETIKLDSHFSTSSDELAEGDGGGYRASIISAYRQELQDDEQQGGEPDAKMCLWKPLPKPPVERVWGVGGVAMI
ncbi:hypothetical protein TWF696_001632 [Orbilia brochopaga]|uniref:Uncharacterized protein n=1 Tax=Orbilia brochopaga TaxID=3140254 RepID=A0AAV9UA01_9PEZI